MSDTLTNNTPAPRQHAPKAGDPAARNLRPITEDAAHAEPPAERLKFEMPQADLPGPPSMTNHTETAKVARPLPIFTVHAVLDDFPFDVQFSGSADQFAATLKRLRDIGATPPTPAARQAVEAEKERAAPICEFHGPMKESSKKAGTYYCPAKMGDGSYCKSKA